MRLIFQRTSYLCEHKVIKINHGIALIAHIHIATLFDIDCLHQGLFGSSIISHRHHPGGIGVGVELFIEEDDVQVGLGRLVAAAGAGRGVQQAGQSAIIADIGGQGSGVVLIYSIYRRR